MKDYLPTLLIQELTVFKHIFWEGEFNFMSYTHS